MKKVITRKNVLQQLKDDLIGKDSYRGVTLTYSWLANQFGHLSLGFIPTLLISIFFRKNYHTEHTAILSAAIVSLGWFLFELVNFLYPLLSSNRLKINLFILKNRKYNFQPAWSNVAFDTFTDVCFFSVGAFLASLFICWSHTALSILLTLIIFLVYPCRYWFLTKMYIQSAHYPFQFRLSQWTNAIDKNGKKTVADFLADETRKTHLFIFGGLDSGKTSLSVGIATEFSINHHACVYTTGMKLYSMFYSKKARSFPRSFWSWRNASLLVIDDINPGSPVKEDLVTAEEFLNMLDTLDRQDVHISPNKSNRKALSEKNVIWVMGNESTKFYSSWKKMLQDIGVKGEDIYSINLSEKIE